MRQRILLTVTVIVFGAAAGHGQTDDPSTSAAYLSAPTSANGPVSLIRGRGGVASAKVDGGEQPPSALPTVAGEPIPWVAEQERTGLGTPPATTETATAPNAPRAPLLDRLPGSTGELVKVGGALAVVLGLLMLFRLVIRRSGALASAGRPSGVLEVLARYPVGRGQHLVLLKLARRLVLVHQSGGTMRTLSEVVDPDEVAALLSRVEAASRQKSTDRFMATLDAAQTRPEPPGPVALPDAVRGEVVDLTRRSRRNRLGLAARGGGISFTALLLIAAPAFGQDLTGVNPIEVLEEAAQAAPGFEGGLSGPLNILLLLTVLTLAPALLVLCTCFTRIVVVLGLLRQALGTQGLPPSQVVVGLSLFITFVVMAPTGQRMYDEGIAPYMSGEITDPAEAWSRTKQPLRDFMFAQIEATGNWSSVYMMLNYRGVDTSEPERLTRADVDMLSLVPAYILSELKVAFLMGFRIYMPFLVIDMVIASMLISMGMLMLPPVLISLPFKLLLFVLVDGWQLVVGSLMTSVMQPESIVAMGVF